MQIIHTKPARAPSRRVLLKLATTTLLSAGALPARAEPGITASEIQIGQNITLMDGRNLYGVEVLAGMKALFDEVNRNGGVLGRKISLRTLDDQNEPARAEANARQLAKDGAFILFGSVEGGPSTAVMAVANDLKLPFFGPLAGSPGLRRPTQPLVFVVRAEHRDEFQALMQHGLRVGLKRVALFHADSAGGREHLANVQKLTADIGMAFGGGVPFKSGITDAELHARPHPRRPAGDIQCELLPALANRHGLITGATGTGKTITLQTLAESFSRIGVPVFMADVKGDLTGITQAGSLSPKLAGHPEGTRPAAPEPSGLPGHAVGRVRRAGPPGARHRQRHGPAAAGAHAGAQRDAGRRAEPGVQDRRRQRPAAAGHEGPARDAAVRGRQRAASSPPSTATSAPPASAPSSAGCCRSRNRAATSSSASRCSTSATSCRPSTARA
jgi:hypothetical protein